MIGAVVEEDLHGMMEAHPMITDGKTRSGAEQEGAEVEEEGGEMTEETGGLTMKTQIVIGHKDGAGTGATTMAMIQALP